MAICILCLWRSYRRSFCFSVFIRLSGFMLAIVSVFCPAWSERVVCLFLVLLYMQILDFFVFPFFLGVFLTYMPWFLVVGFFIFVIFVLFWCFLFLCPGALWFCLFQVLSEFVDCGVSACFVGC